MTSERGQPLYKSQTSPDVSLLHSYLSSVHTLGQFYNVYVTANTRMSLPQQVKTVLALTFLDEPDRRVEFNHWQYWYNLQANPNQKAFDIGECCKRFHGGLNGSTCSAM